MQQEQFQGTLEHIGKWGLPIFLSPTSEVLRQNSHVLSMIYSREAGVRHRRLVLAYDRTYLVSTTQLVRTHLGSALSGGAHRPPGWDLPDESLFLIDRSKGEQQFDMKSRQKAGEMASFLVWDSTRPKSPKIETASYPVLAAASKHGAFERDFPHPSHSRGKFEMLARLGQVLQETTCIRFVLMDGAGAHEWCHRVLLGQTLPLSEELLEALPSFWRNLRFEDLPCAGHALGYRIAMVGSEPISYVPGIAHLAKNYVEQCRSHLRTILVGKIKVDASGGLQLGMWPAAYVGNDAMSDSQAALWLLGQ